MRIRLHPDAEPELRDIDRWYENRREGLGDAFILAVEQAKNHIQEHPDRWPLWPNLRHTPPIRRFLLPEYPFALPYLVRDEDVVVLAVAHLRRRPDYWLPRARSRP
ncbi:type II toxin-antitoxin system RelE/ParE family toxin [Corallococcus exercitus]|uniref:type II toxin-antitoxin system RelE/ParE family toxin n=1 Tax=Corallococcus exercitus TaxID=2316736 RepID=UPI0035D42CB9